MPTTLIKNILDEPAADDAAEALPARWHAMHVGLRITEGFVTFRSLHMHDYKLEAGCAWPSYAYEFEDLVAQGRINGDGTLALEQTMQDKNRTRVSPSVNEITRAVEVTYWPAKYLAGAAHLCEAVNVVSFAHAIERDAGWVVRKRGGYADTWLQRHENGCAIIAENLIAARVRVF